MIICTAGHDAEAVLLQCLGECRRILLHLLCIFLKTRLKRLAKGNRLRCNDMHEWTALNSGEYCLVKLLAKFFITAENHAAARAAKGLVCRRRHNIGIRNGARMLACCNQTSDMSNVHHEVCADLLCNLAKAREIDDTRISRSARNDHLRLLLHGDSFELVIIDRLCVLRDAVRNDVKVLAAHVNRAAVCQVTAVRETHTHDRVTRLKECKEDCHIGLCAGMGLNVGITCIKKFFCALNGKAFDDIDELTAAIVTLAGIALGILIRKNAALRFENGFGYNVLRCDEFELCALTIQFFVNGFCKRRIRFV